MKDKPKVNGYLLRAIDALNSQLSQFIFCAIFWLLAVYVVCFTTFWIDPFQDVLKISFLLWDVFADLFGFQHVEMN